MPKKITIEIRTTNAVFNDGEGEDYMREVARLLSKCVGKIQYQLHRPECLCDAPEVADTLMDINGNTVGFVRVE